MSQQINNKKGFTIIEVVLVLAIAGLIFLMVFIALPALQRSQRDSQREQDLSRFMSQISSYQSNNRNKVPAADNVSNFVDGYLKVGGDTFEDPSGKDYNVNGGTGAVDAPTIGDNDEGLGDIYYRTAARCGDDGAIVAATDQANKVAVTIALEGGGALCQQN